MKTAIITILVLIGIVGVPRYFAYQKAQENRSVFQYSKTEYVDNATKNCVRDGTPEATCRCFYNKFLETHTVQETLKFDTEASANPDFQLTQEQMGMFSQCI